MALPFRRVISIDFEYRADPGCLPHVWCLVARDAVTGREIGRWWRNRLLKMRQPPFPTDRDTLVTSYGISAEMACFLQLGWKPPEYLLDLYAEFRWLTNGRTLEFAGKDMNKLKKHKSSMLAAAFILDVPTMDIAHKEAMRQMFITQRDFTADQRAQGMDYCSDDTLITHNILRRMEPALDLPRALLRGRFGLAIACMERVATPVDNVNVARINADWPGLMRDIVGVAQDMYGVFKNGEISDELLIGYAKRHDMLGRWPKTKTGKLSYGKKTMKRLVEVYPQLDILKEILSTKGATKLLGLAIGPDGRNRVDLIPFRAKTGRNQPSSKGFIFGPAVWLRFLIMAERGWAIAYLDFSAEEVCILAALSDDPNLQADCLTGDPYVAFAVRAGMAPPGTTKATDTAGVRDIVKVLFLSLNYGRTVVGLAEELGWPLWKARDLVNRHRRAYPVAHRWLQGIIDHAALRGHQLSTLGWQRVVEEGFNPRSIRNWPCQTAGSEIMMLSAIMMTEAGIQVCAPVHDAFLIAAPVDQIDAEMARAKAIMEEAALTVTGGFPITVDAKPYPHGTRYSDKRGTRMWELVMGLLNEREAERERAA
jgi:hypothetical protein